MKKILIGSRALNYYLPVDIKESTDYDYLVDDLDSKRVLNLIKVKYKVNLQEEYHIIPPLRYRYKDKDIISLEDFYTLKLSHSLWDIHWEKTLYHIYLIRKHFPNIEYDKQLFKELYSYWESVHGKRKTSDLTLNSKEFFDNAIQYDIEHDELHKLFKDPPTYTKILKGEVEPDEEKFNQLSFDEKLDLVREEVYVMAVERYSKLDYRESYSIMLKKFTLYHAPIWEALFIVTNHSKLTKPQFNFIEYVNNRKS